MTNQEAIHIRGLTRSYQQRPALQGLDLSLDHGQIVGLMGENGCGKTTLLKVLAGLLADYQGVVRIEGQPVGPATKAMVSYLPDTSFLPDSITPTQAIRLYGDYFVDFDAERAASMIEYFRLDQTQPLRAMSKGMREKVQIALAMSRRARVFLLDEPISGVDPAARQMILDGIIRNFAPDSLMIISTHLIQDIEPVIDHAVFLRVGQVVLAGDADELRAERGASLDQIFRKEFAWSAN